MPETVTVRWRWSNGDVAKAIVNIDATELKVPRPDGTFASFRADSNEIDEDGFVVVTEEPSTGARG